MEPSDEAQGVAQSSTGTVSKANNLGALGDLSQYDSDSSGNESVREVGSIPSTCYREAPLPDSSSSSSSSDTSEEEDESSTQSSSEDEFNGASAQQIAKTKPAKPIGEVGLDDLPPIEDLTISVAEQQCVEIGKITAIVDKLIVVQSMKNKPPLDLDSILFLEKGQRTLGRVFDVIGPVGEPAYCVRFNSEDHIKEKGVEKDMVVYCAPQTDHTSYVNLDELMKFKGSDASWKGNNEPPVQFIDFSDDEDEKRTRRKRNVDGSSSSGQPCVEPSSYERRMNAKNLARSRMPRQQGGYFNPAAAPHHHHHQHQHHQQQQMPQNVIPNLPPVHAFGSQPVWPHMMPPDRFVPPPYQFGMPPGPLYPMPPRMPPMPMRGPPGPSMPRFYRPRY